VGWGDHSPPWPAGFNIRHSVIPVRTDLFQGTKTTWIPMQHTTPITIITIAANG
jgi:hypothetical protein